MVFGMENMNDSEDYGDDGLHIINVIMQVTWINPLFTNRKNFERIY